MKSEVFDPIDRAIAAVLAREADGRVAERYIREVALRLIAARNRAIGPSGPLTPTGGKRNNHA